MSGELWRNARVCGWMWLSLAGCFGGEDYEEPTWSPPPDTTVPRDRNVTFTGPDANLEGTLSVPDDAVAGDRFPAVLLVHGSGPVNRDATVFGQLGMSFGFPVSPFRQLALRLESAGYAVLRYDKRTCGQFNDCANNAYPVPKADLRVDDFIADAQSAVAFLKRQPDVIPEQIFVVGHSQGGSFVPQILADDETLAGGILMATPFDAVDVVLFDQYERLKTLLSESELSESEIREELSPLELIVAQLRAMRQDAHDGSDIGGVSADFWQSWLDVSDAAPDIVRTLARPLLAIGGEYDWNVPPEHVDAWQTVFDESSDAVRETARVPCVTHALNCISEPDYQKVVQDDIGADVEDTFAETILAFLDAQRGAASP